MPKLPRELKSPAQPGVGPSSLSSWNTVGKTNTPRNSGHPGHASRRKEELEREGKEYKFYIFPSLERETFLSSTVAAEISTWPSPKLGKYRSSKIKGDAWVTCPLGLN